MRCCGLCSIGMSPSSNVWIGAWWIGFVITGFSALLISLPTFGFPKRLPDAVNTHEAHEVDFRALKGDTLQVRLADMPRAVFYLLQNYTFLFISLAATVESESSSRSRWLHRPPAQAGFRS